MLLVIIAALALALVAERFKREAELQRALAVAQAFAEQCRAEADLAEAQARLAEARAAAVEARLRESPDPRQGPR
jgi:hypothetical protein